jgi:hypothetical protein
MRASIMRDVQCEQRGRSIAVKDCWDEVILLPCFWAGAFTDSLSPMVADGWAVMEQHAPRVPEPVVNIAHIPKELTN